MQHLEIIDIGNQVICDFSDKDFTDSESVGGFVFGSKGCCPDCAPRMMQNIEKYNEQKYIKDRALPGESFASFILRYRGENNTVTIYSEDK